MILLMDNYDSFTFNLYQILAGFSKTVVVKRNDEISVADIWRMQPSHVVISPGPCGPEQAGICLDLVRHVSGQIPLLGVCLGHQCLAQAFGASISKAKTVMHGKTSQMIHDGAGLFANIENPFLATRYHSLIVDEASLPLCLQVTARAPDQTIMAIKHRQHVSVGVQFHPESILTPVGERLLQNFIEGRV